MVAQQTLTLFVWVQILVPQPKEKTDSIESVFSFGRSIGASYLALRAKRRRIRFAFEPKAVGELAHQRLGEEFSLLRSKNEYPSARHLFSFIVANTDINIHVYFPLISSVDNKLPFPTSLPCASLVCLPSNVPRSLPCASRIVSLLPLASILPISLPCLSRNSCFVIVISPF